MRKILPVFLFSIFYFLFSTSWAYAEECSPSCSGIDECQKKIDECQKLISISVSATKPHEEKAAELQRDIDAIEANIDSLTKQINLKKAAIMADEKKLEARQEVLETQIRDYYKRGYTSSLEYVLVTFLSGNNVSEAIRLLGYHQNLIDQEKKIITSIVLQVTDLNQAKQKLEQTTTWLADRKDSLEIIIAPIRKLVSEAKAYQSKLSATVGQLSARQQELLAEKTGNFQTSVGEVPLADDAASRPDYEPGFRPAFAGFSFGAPHRKGMSQYGAFGRAKNGQNAEDILKAYYGSGIEIKKDYSTGVNISVQGFGSFNIEDYAKRIYEMPGSWGDEGGYEALKAQAVAARSYALAYTSNGSGSICATESCQVFKAEPKGGNWERAVNDTRGWVMMVNGQPLSAWYASTSGGYTTGYSSNGYSTPGEWDTKCGSQSCWTNDAYEKIASSPWFYKAWYRPRYSSPSRSHPWLNKDEFVDIVNAVLLYTKDNGTLSHLSQTDKSNSDTWSRDEVRSRLGGDAISSVGSVSVTYSTGGYTSNVNIDGRNIDGGTFRQIFNIRAPGEIWLASTLFNIEKK